MKRVTICVLASFSCTGCDLQATGRLMQFALKELSKPPPPHDEQFGRSGPVAARALSDDTVWFEVHDADGIARLELRQGERVWKLKPTSAAVVRRSDRLFYARVSPIRDGQIVAVVHDRLGNTVEQVLTKTGLHMDPPIFPENGDLSGWRE